MKKVEVIKNHHDCYCSVAECEEERELDYYFDEYFNEYNLGDKLTETDLNVLKSEFEKVKYLPSGSCYCLNKSKFEPHSEIWVLLSAKIV
jgi:hypothetical protein